MNPIILSCYLELNEMKTFENNKFNKILVILDTLRVVIKLMTEIMRIHFSHIHYEY